MEPEVTQGMFDYYKVADHLQSGYGGGWSVGVSPERVEIDVNDEYGLTFTHQEFIKFTSEILAHMTVKARNAPPSPATFDPQATYPQEPHPPGGNATST